MLQSWHYWAGKMQSKYKLLITAAALVIAMGAVALVWWLTDPLSAGRFWHEHAATVLQYAAPPVIALVGWTGQQILAPRFSRSTPDQLMLAQQDLARRGLEWWRGVPEPAWPGRLLRAGLRPLDVPWVMRLPAGLAAANAPASTSIADLATWFRDGQNCRLVIRGPASSGKSVLARQLTAELLKNRRPDDPVPVFLPLWSWDPEQRSMHDWMKYRIELAYPELEDEATYGPTAVAGLVHQGRVLPILDGLDALPRACRAKVLDDGELMSQAPLIVTGRTDVSPALDDVSPALDDFVVIEPGRVPAEESDRFLTEITRVNVFDKLKCQFVDAAGGGATCEELRQVLSVPRIIYLASIVYQAPSEPDNRAAQSDTATTLYAKVEGFLLRSLIPALLPAGTNWCRPFPWYAPNATTWLERLAQLDLRDPDDRCQGPACRPAPSDPGDLQGGADLYDPASSRIAWWNLHRDVRPLRRYQAPLRGLIAGLIAFGACTLIFRYYPPHYNWGYSLMTAGAYGLLILIACSFLGGERRREPDIPLENGNSRLATSRWMIRHYWARWWPILLAAAGGFCCVGILIGARVAMETKHTTQAGLRTGLWDGFVQGVVLLVLVYTIAGVPAAPRTVRASDFPSPGRPGIRTFTTAVLLGLAFGLLWGAAAVLKHESSQTPSLWPAIGTGLISGVDFALGAWLFRWSRRWFRLGPASDPRSAARLDLVGAILRPFILALTFAVSFGITAPFHFVDNYVFTWFVVGFAVGSLDTEWPLYVTAISWRALVRRELPVRLMRFLECCRAAGILRVTSQEYQIHDIGLLYWLRSGGPSRAAAAKAAGVPTPRGMTATHDGAVGLASDAGAQDAVHGPDAGLPGSGQQGAPQF